MAWNENVTQMTTSTTNLADNFNKIHLELLENTKDNKANKIDKTLYDQDKLKLEETIAQVQNEVKEVVQLVDNVPQGATQGLFFVRK